MNHFKAFDTFSEGINELINVIPNITEYVGGDAKLPTERDVIFNLLNITSLSIPSIFNPEYPATYSITVSATEVGFKTRGFYSFGWKVNPNTGKYSFRVSFGDNARSIVKNRIEESLTKLNWNAVEFAHKVPKKPRRDKDQIHRDGINEVDNASNITDGIDNYIDHDPEEVRK